MNRLLLLVAVIFYLSLVALSQTNNSSTAPGRQGSVRVDSIPLSDKLSSEKPQANGRRSKSALSDHARDSLNQRDEADGHFWVNTEFLLWRMKGGDVPPLVAAGPVGDRFPGIISGARVLFGGDSLDRGNFPGGRLTAGFWLNRNRTIGVEGRYFFLTNRNVGFSVSSDDLPPSQQYITRPLINPRTGEEDLSSIVSGGSQVRGSIAVSSPSHLQGGEANLVIRLSKGQGSSVNWLTGFRHLNLKEAVNILQNTRSLTRFYSLIDRFATRNYFYGGQSGFQILLRRARFRIEAQAQLALGSTTQVVDISGSTFLVVNQGAPLEAVFTSEGGVLAVPNTNLGRYRRNRFTVLPEASASLSYRLTPRQRILAGYDFLYSSSVVRPGEQIDRAVNLDRIPLLIVNPFGPPHGPLRPAFSFRDASFWAQGLNIGIQTRF